MQPFRHPKIKTLPKRSWFSNVLYLTLLGYMKFVHDHFYYRKIQFLNKENVPPVGTPLLVVSNHQNALNDPLAIEFAFSDRVVTIFTRADAFEHRFIGKFLRSLYLLPAYRMRTDGAETLQYNYAMFDEAGGRLRGGHAVAIFPEATNQVIRWLGDFSLAYLRMAFETAESSDFEQDIVILPVAHHYADYFAMQEDMLLRCGTPISLKPYYELYKTKPRTAQRQVNKLVREQLEDMMLNITDLENYEAIDYLRETYGVRFSERLHLNPDDLAQKLEADKQFVARLNQLREAQPEKMKDIYARTLHLKGKFKDLKLSEDVLLRRSSNFQLMLQGLALVILLPLFIYSLIPNILVYYGVEPFVNMFRRKGGKFELFASGVRFALMTLYAMPLFYVGTMLLEGFYLSWIYALIHFLLMPWLGVFAVHYVKNFKIWRKIIKFNFLKAYRFSKLQEAINERNDLFADLYRLIENQK